MSGGTYDDLVDGVGADEDALGSRLKTTERHLETRHRVRRPVSPSTTFEHVPHELDWQQDDHASEQSDQRRHH